MKFLSIDSCFENSSPVLLQGVIRESSEILRILFIIRFRDLLRSKHKRHNEHTHTNGMSMERILTIARWIYALLFFFIGAKSLLVLVGFLPSSDYPGSPEAKAFAEAIFSEGFISPLMSITFFISGILIVIKRTAPLGLVLLAPFIVGILFTHLLYEPNPLFGILIAMLWLLFAWQFRKAYRPMWNYRDPM